MPRISSPKISDDAWWDAFEGGKEVGFEGLKLAIEVVAKDYAFLAAVGHEIYGMAMEEYGEITQKVVHNPILTRGYGIEPNDSYFTEKFLRRRSRKTMTGAAISGVGVGLSAVTSVNVLGIVRHANAEASSIGHMASLISLAKKHKKSKTVERWLRVAMLAKGMKIFGRAGNIAADAIPVPFVGGGIGAFISVYNIGRQAALQGVMSRVAMEIHARAHREVVLTRMLVRTDRVQQGGFSRNTFYGNAGPASSVIYSLLHRYNALRALGAYDVPSFILETAGWMVVYDKLMST